MTPNPDAPVQQQSWFGRNWKWLVPVGCLVPVLCCGTFGASVFFGVTRVIQGSGAFREGLTRASANEDVKALLGTPLEPGMTVQGSLNNGVANFDAAIKGPKGDGTLHVEAREGGGAVTFQALEVRAQGKVIDLLKRPAGPPPRGDDGQPADSDDVDDGEDADDGDDAPTTPSGREP